MAFADHLSVDGRLLWWGLEVSVDNFATIDHRWATHSGTVEAAFFEERIVSIGNIQRGLGSNHLPVASSVSLVLDNTDFALDFLVSPSLTPAQLFPARFRLKCGLADPATPTVVTQKVGTFVTLDFPRRKDGFIHLSLADDSIAALADCLVPPTPREWFDTNPGTTNSVFPTNIGNVEPLMDWGLPAPLQFGRPWYIGQGVATFANDRTPVDYDTAGGFEPGHRKYIYPILVLATRDTATITTDDARTLRGVYRADVVNDNYGLAKAPPLEIPATFNNYNIWKAYKTDTITKDGYAWKLLWIAIDVYNYTRWVISTSAGYTVNNNLPQGLFQSIPSSPDYPAPNVIKPSPGSPPAGLLPPFIPYRGYFAAFDYFLVNGAPGSGITGKSDLTNVCDPCNIMQDLVEHYSELGASAVDTARFARAQLVTKILATGSIFFGDARERSNNGDVQLNDKVSPYGVGTLRRTIAELAGSCDLDVFITMEGKVAVATQGADFETQTTTYTNIDEERIANVEDRIPSQGERWSPYNRVFLQMRGGQAGPYDTPDGGVAGWGRVLPRVLGTKWWWNANYEGAATSLVGNVWNFRNLEARVRPIISFQTDLAILGVDLADYFTMSWTRGGQNAAYTNALWRLESVKINPENGSCDVTAVWMDELGDEQPFLLDNEALLIRSQPAFGQTLTVTDGGTTMTRSGGSFLIDGVAAGDLVRLRDSAEALATFFRNRDVRVASVTNALNLVITGDTDFGTAGAHVLADTDWTIVRGASTYPTAVSDPAQYPSGGAMYGKTSDSAGDYSSGAANKLLDG